MRRRHGRTIAVGAVAFLAAHIGPAGAFVPAAAGVDGVAEDQRLLDVLSVHAIKRGVPGDVPPASPSQEGDAIPEVIVIDRPLVELAPGASDTTLVRLVNNATPLFGYSLALKAMPLGDATGEVRVLVRSTNFFPAQHLILADPQGAPLDPVFSVILPWREAGVFINANTEIGHEVLAGFDVNDVLAEVVFEASPDAEGIFAWDLGPATALADAVGAPLAFTFCGGRIAVNVATDRPADLDGDGSVGFADLLGVISQWGPCPPKSACPPDLNCDAVVDFLDVLRVLSEWG